MYREICVLLKSSLFGMDRLSPEEYSIINSISDWNLIVNEMKAQGVLGLIYELTDKINIQDKSQYSIIRMEGMHALSRWHQVAYAQNELVNLLHNSDIRFVIIKGTAAGMYYPNAVLRSAGDIDFLVKRKDYDMTHELLVQNGYVLSNHSSETEHHNTYIKNGVVFELHRWLGAINPSDETKMVLFENNIDQREQRQIGKYSFPTCNDSINGLILLNHINQHLREGIGLRHIIDWMMFVNSYVTDEVWENGFWQLSNEFGLQKLAIVVTALCQKYLGLNDSIHWCCYADMETCDELMEYIIARGNFGCKKDDEDRIASFWITVHDPISFFKRLQKYGLHRWGKAQKYSFLKPFAWIYQLVYIIKTLRSQKRSFSEMKALHKEGKKQADLIMKLGLDR